MTRTDWHTNTPDQAREWERIHSDAYDDTPTRAEAEADAALDARYPMQATPGPLTEAMRLHRYAECREAAEAARQAGDGDLSRYWDKQAERWAG